MGPVGNVNRWKPWRTRVIWWRAGTAVSGNRSIHCATSGCLRSGGAVEMLPGKSGREIMTQPAGQTQQEPTGLKPRKGGRAGWVRALLGFAITGVFVFLVARQLSPAQVLDTLSTLNPAWLFV